MRFAIDEMTRAMRSNDANYDGKFWVGVRTTGIYCLPSCRAKLPLLKNVTFYATREEAIQAGLRGCKRCRSEFFPHTEPEWLIEMLTLMKDKQHVKLDELALSELAQVDITTIRRYFKQYHGTTPLAYHRKIRLRRARRLLKLGENYLAVAYDCGFESPSGFRDAFVKEFGITPGRVHIG
jgi:AraC family transcriptional regulator of adaptative response/methylated-DNA-[protein]-cysteine methyltransferase